MLVLRPFRAINHHAVRTEHHVQKQPSGQQNHTQSSQPPAGAVNNIPERTSPVDATLRKCLRLGCPLDHCTKAFLWIREFPDFGQLVYSKIHCFAAALSLLSSPCEGAS